MLWSKEKAWGILLLTLFWHFLQDSKNPVVDALIQRQQKCLSYLDDLKNQVDELAKAAGISPEMLEASSTKESKKADLKSNVPKKEQVTLKYLWSS